MALMSSQMFRFHGIPSKEESEDKAVTVRPSSTALFCIDSADRYATLNDRATGGTTPYTYQITRNQALLSGFFKRIALTEVVFPYYIPNINEKTNTILFSENGGAFQVILLSLTGFKTPQEIAEELETQLQISTGNLGFTVGYANGRFSFITNTVDTIQFARGNFAGGARRDEFQLYDLLNLSGPGLNGLTNATTSLLSGITRCRYTEYIDIVSTQLTYYQDLKDASSDPIVRDVLCRIYLEDETSPIVPVYQTAVPAGPVMPYDTAIPGTYPFTIYRKFALPKQIQWNNTQSLGNVSFEVYDDKGQILSNHQGPQFPDSTMPDWRITLLVSEN